MIKLDRVEMADGTVYRNLYYGQDWEELGFCSESDIPTILFFFRQNGEFKELELDTDKIVDIALADNEEGPSKFSMVYNGENHRYVLYNMESEMNEDWGDSEFPYHPKLEEVNYLAEELMDRMIEEYDIDEHDGFMIADNMVSIILGYLETALNLDDEETTAEYIYGNGMVISILATAFACDKIEQGKTKELLKNVVDIVPEFAMFVEDNKDSIKIVYQNPDEDAQK